MKGMWALIAVLGCTKTGPQDRETGAVDGPVNAVFVADSHVIGPQYTCCSEGEGLDNESIMKTPDRLRSVVAAINAIEPAPDAVFLLGDVVHDAHHGTDLDVYEQEETAFSRAADLLGELTIPLHIVWGNHDYEVRCGGGDGHHSRDFTHGLFERFFDAPITDAVTIGAWRFVLLNSQLGPTWDASDAACATGTGSYGEEQLAWLDAQLSVGDPTVVMSHHHMIASTARNENEGPNPDLSTVLGRHDNARVHLAGHLHRWVDLAATTVHPVQHIIMGATRYDDDNFWVGEFRANGDFEFRDQAKPKWNTTCADTWSYREPWGAVPDVAETGDCGS
ncbi:MAG: metallophosphoesterase [Myxococcota bacterium]|nr:metallophosphoesterase [Myxococcota bacterium]MEC9389899.1 metallophosphoesterase [Myxococcota bacterium]